SRCRAVLCRHGVNRRRTRGAVDAIRFRTRLRGIYKIPADAFAMGRGVCLAPILGHRLDRVRPPGCARGGGVAGPRPGHRDGPVVAAKRWRRRSGTGVADSGGVHGMWLLVDDAKRLIESVWTMNQECLFGCPEHSSRARRSM